MNTAAPQVPLTELESVRGHFSIIGVRQFGDPILREEARPIELPRDLALANEILDCLQTTIQSARRLHPFSRGIGLAAPQIGLRRRVAIIHPVDSVPLRMVNPRIVDQSPELDTQFEGCLSFFDFRGEVQRPVAVTVEFEDLSGAVRKCDLEGDAARLALHEVDHLDGVLYLDRMTPDGRLVEATSELP